MRPSIVLVAAVAVVAVQSWVLATPRGGAFDFATQSPSTVCPTEKVWQAKASRLGLHDKRDGCPLEGACDAPATRDDAPRAPFTVPLVVHVIRSSAGVPPGAVDAAAIDGQIALLNQHFAPYDVSFTLLEVQNHDDDGLTCIRPLSFFNQDWLVDIQTMKDTYATQWTEALNVFVSCQSSSLFGVLGGFAIFPWDPDALSARGGVWMNADYFGPDQSVLTHEIGHSLGLWHPHRGVAETLDCSDPCSENVHAADDPLADTVGDFCKDTPATAANAACADPDGTDCNGLPFVDTDYTNFMGYAPETCVDHFTPEQTQRIHCWVRDALGPLLDDQLVTAHVASIRLDSESQSSSTRRGRACVAVVDAGGEPVAGATVHVRWTGSYEGTGSAVTDVAGEAVLLTPWRTASVFCWQVEVTALEGTYLAYDAAANAVSRTSAGKGCGSGPILVDQPVGREVPIFDGIVPNPFNPRTTIHFRLPAPSRVGLDVVDVAGRRVVRLLDAAQAAGRHEIAWDGLDAWGRQAASGVYFAVLRTPAGVATQRLVLLK